MSLKVLCIGNSFSQNALTYICDMAAAARVEDFAFENAYIGGCSLEDHAANAKTNAAVYDGQVFKIGGGFFDGYGKIGLKDFLRLKAWDFITLQQASRFGWNPETYNGDITYLTGFIQDNAMNRNVKIGWHMTWAYAEKLERYVEELLDGTDYAGKPLLMYRDTVNAVRAKIVPNGDFKFIIPSGTAIQNARGVFGDTLHTEDGVHLNGRGCFIAGATYLKALTGKDAAHGIGVFNVQETERVRRCVRTACESPWELQEII